MLSHGQQQIHQQVYELWRLRKKFSESCDAWTPSNSQVEASNKASNNV